MKKITVIAIPDNTRVLINFGKMDCSPGSELAEGDRINITQELTKIIDPSTETSLGNYYFIKDTLTITDMFDNFSIARKEIVKKDGFTLSPMLLPGSKVSYDTLNVNTSDILNLPDIEKEIRIGDIVIPK